MRIENEVKLDYKDVLIRPKRSTLSSRKDVTLTKEYSFKWGGGFAGIPLIAANMDGVGTCAMATKLAEFTMYTSMTRKERTKLFGSLPEKSRVTYEIPTYGITDDERNSLCDHMRGYHIDTVCIDVANGYQESFVEFIKQLREYFDYHSEEIMNQPNIIAGNVVTPEMTEELLLAGADIVKVGIGQGSACTTRLVAGVGYPQLSAVIECADAAHGLGGHIIADGGIVHVGDIAKAFGAGADFVMMGGMFAGHDEGGLVKGKIGEFTVPFHGNSSSVAREDKEYRASEGRVTEIPYKGPVENTVKEILGGLRSACTYSGAKSLKELPKRTTFIRCNSTHNTVFENNTVGK